MSRIPRTIRVGRDCRVTIKRQPEYNTYVIRQYVGRKIVAEYEGDIGRTPEDKRENLRDIRGTAAKMVRWLRKNRTACR